MKSRMQMKFSQRYKKEVEVVLAGGIGNQLFQYFAGAFLAMQTSSDLVINAHLAQFTRTGHSDWIQDLGLPAQSYKAAAKKASSEFLFETLRRVSREVFARILISPNLQVKVLKYFKSTEVGLDERFLQMSEPLVISGYFQTPFFFDELATAGRLPRIDSTGFSGWFHKVHESISASNALVIHLRRGDYLLHAHNLGVLDRDYYSGAIERLRREGASWDKVFVFSDDLTLAKEEFKALSDGTWVFVDPPAAVSSSESLILMSAAKYIIIGNSTFSWWAAKLSDADIVVRPEKWFRNLADPKKLFPVHWLSVESFWK